MKSRFLIVFLAVLSTAAYGLDVKAGISPPPAAQPAGTAKTETDSDGDGVIDYTVYFLKSGQKEHEEFDFNRDAKMDDFLYYGEGLIIREEIDSNFDGKIDIWVYLIGGKLIKRYERDLDGDGTAEIVKDYDKL